MSENFNVLVDRAMREGGRHHICYGSQRFSEDLDFAGGKEFNRNDLNNIKHCIEKYIGERYGFEVSVKEPKELAAESINENIKVEKWQVSVTTSPGVRNMPKQKIKIEVINVPAYTRVPKVLKKNYDFLPDGYSDIFIMSETLDELYADKIISLVNTEKYVRHRDIWDLRWIRQQGAMLDIQLIKNKIHDYNITNFGKKLDKTLSNLHSIIHGEAFKAQMSRFIPIDAQERTLNNAKFFNHLTEELKQLLLETKNKLK